MDELTNALDVAENSLSLTERGWNFLTRFPLPRLGTLRKSSGDAELRSSITAPDGTSWQFEARTSPGQVRNALAIGKEAFESLGPGDFSTEDLDDEWQDRFWDDAKRKYTQDAQAIYASILAGELRQAGSFSKKTLSILDDLDEKAARTFQRYCTLAAQFGRLKALIHAPPNWDCMANELSEFGITYTDVGTLAAHGLVRDQVAALGTEQFMYRDEPPPETPIHYFAFARDIYVLEDTEEVRLTDLAVILATDAGNELASIVEPATSVDLEAYKRRLFEELDDMGAKVRHIGMFSES